MTTYKTFKDVIDKVGPDALARGLNVPDNRVAVWKFRDRIPSKYWRRIAAIAASLGLDGITIAELCRLEEVRVS